MESLLEIIVDRLNDAPYGTVKRISREGGVCYDTILRIKRGQIANPKVRTLETIRAGLDKHWPVRD